ncbi:MULTISPECIES: hypothetical protein [unclassified Streptomyces]|uniref:hypothetical protein n=1 Tax=unclassified Streptomyces TaxID=2593676 RepID=UPI0004CA3AB8|nr:MULTISPECIES: hypothetical protein [unclassified Streptomyces]KOV99662.1 hypothetical protein ADL02_04690 [Streptomyces sp. NRRL WC-3723]
MSEIVVVYELEQPGAARAPAAGPPGAERLPRRVHAAPTAPGRPDAAGPRTLCGKDTFAMTKAPRTPSRHPGEPWYPDAYASLVCPDCDAVMEV